jgi:hypothetical protein
MSFDEFLSYCRTLEGTPINAVGGRASFTVELVNDKVRFKPVSTGESQPEMRPKRTQAILDRLASTGSFELGTYSDLTSFQKSYILGVMKHRADISSSRLGAFPDPLNIVVQSAVSPIPIDRLREVTDLDTWEAIQIVLDHGIPTPFADSVGYDLITVDGARLPPEVVFAVALERVLGYTILPGQFTTGEYSPCFAILRSQGYAIISKKQSIPEADAADDEFPEGMVKLRRHAYKERHSAAAKAKKAEAFRLHGVLKCERCDEDWVHKYGPDAAASCIEVHHHAVAVSDMSPNHRTKLSDLQCLCANCHRIVHHQLRSSNDAI